MSQDTDDARFLELLAPRVEDERTRNRINSVAYLLRKPMPVTSHKVLMYDAPWLRSLTDAAVTDLTEPESDRLRAIAYGIDGQA